MPLTPGARGEARGGRGFGVVGSGQFRIGRRVDCLAFAEACKTQPRWGWVCAFLDYQGRSRFAPPTLRSPTESRWDSLALGVRNAKRNCVTVWSRLHASRRWVRDCGFW